ncbi:MAG: hypothetical protein KDB03_18615 [Planctomycetales bacterium]|nr:hypothetical protein [Planctomycetales bacterium]
MMCCRTSQLIALCCAVTFALNSHAADGMQKGTPQLKQAGPLAFAPDGVLLIGDTQSASIFAIDTQDHGGGNAGSEINVSGINQKIAAMIGSATNDTLINDMVVNPSSGNVYLSVSRGRGPDAVPLIFKVDSKGALSELALENVNFAQASLDNAPKGDPARGGRDPRLSSITDIQFNSGKVIVAGLSNEEFASTLRVIDYPFDGRTQSTGIEIYHGAHGRLETASPVRTFITYENTVLAAYTCTPLVSIPVDDLKPQSRTKGRTIAELGNRNTPLDMIIYRKGDQDYLLMANTARGVMKLKLNKAQIDSAESISTRIDGTAGIGYETIESLKNVDQLDKLDDSRAVLLVSNANQVDLKTIQLP